MAKHTACLLCIGGCWHCSFPVINANPDLIGCERVKHLSVLL